MQLKLLQTYRIVSNFAISLIMEFIPFIILGYMLPDHSLALSLAYMFIFWALRSLFNMIFNYAFNNLYTKKPQLFLLLRIFPIVACEICILFLYTNNIWLIIVTAIFSGMEGSFNYQPIDIIWNYVSEGADERKLAFTNFLDQMGWLIAGIVGGLFLDFIPQWIVITVSLLLFVASAVPMVVFYFKFKNAPYFNEDFVSTLIQREQENEKVRKMKKEFIREHFITFFLIAPTTWLFYYITSMILYLNTESFFITGTITSIYDGMYGFACLYCGKFLTKVDGKKYACMVSVYMIICMLVIYLVPNLYVIVPVFLSMSLVQPILNIFKVQNFLDKARVLGVANNITVNASNSACLSNFVCYGIGAIGVLPLVITAMVFAAVGTYMMHHTDKKQTKKLVDFLYTNGE